MLQPLRKPSSPRAKELAVSALGAIATAAQASVLPYFPTIMEQLREFLLTGHEDLQPVRIQSLETLGVLVRAVGEPMRPLAEECCQLGLGLCDQVDDPDLRRCTYSLFAALSGLMGESLAPHLPQITTLMLSSLRSAEGIVPQYDGNSAFLLFDDESDGEEEEELMDEDEEEDSEISGYSVENAFFDEKEDTCAALGEISVNASVAFLPYMETVFEEVFKLLECPHLNVRKAAHEALGQFCCALHKACQSCPSEPNAAALQAALARVVPSYMQAVNGEQERQVVMAVLEALTAVLRGCGNLALQPLGGLRSSATCSRPCCRGRQPVRMRTRRRKRTRLNTTPCCWSTLARPSLPWQLRLAGMPLPPSLLASCRYCSARQNRAAQWQRSPLRWGRWLSPSRAWVPPRPSLCPGCSLRC